MIPVVYQKDNLEHKQIIELFEKINSKLNYKKSINEVCSFATVNILVRRAKLKGVFSENLEADITTFISLRDMIVSKAEDEYRNRILQICKTVHWVAYTDISVITPFERYLDPEDRYFKDKVGKWMCFYHNIADAETICKKAIWEHAVVHCKHSSKDDGVICFYVNGDDEFEHYSIIDFMIKNNLIRKTTSGRLYDISFKYDSQTLAGKYGKEFIPELTLSHFVDLDTGEFIDKS